MKSELFGTDGIRGLANVWPMTPEVALAVGRALGYVLREQKAQHARTSLPVGVRPLEGNRPMRRAKIVVGKDTRLSGYMIEHALASGICAMGVDVILIGPLSTPGVAFITQSMRADAGVMISASHNAFHDNGIKVFTADGFKLSDELEAEIAGLVGSPLILQQAVTGDLVGKAFRIDEVHGRYLVALKNHFPADLDLTGFRIAIDCANGAAYKLGPLVFEELGAEVIKRAVAPNGLNINLNCGALHPEAIANTVVEYRADIGIALDGDGDRCIMIDENGEVVDGDQIIGICAIEMARRGELPENTVVTTPMSNVGLEASLGENGIRMLRAPVGDRNVVETMRLGGFSLGGEQSGHIVFLKAATTGDGVLAALKILEAMRRSGKKLSELKKSIRLFPQVREDVHVSQKPPLESLPEVQRSILAAEKALSGRGRVFVRYSGTEKLARVMVEGEDMQVIQGFAHSIASSIQRTLG